MTVNISIASISDAEAILGLQRLAYQSEAALYNDWSIPPLTQTIEQLRAEFGWMKILRARSDHGIVGSVRAGIKDGLCSIGRLIVHPGHQRQGIGSRLMQSIESLFPEAAKFELFTGSESEGNIRLYARLGYTVSRTERLSPKVSLVFLEKPGQGRTRISNCR